MLCDNIIESNSILKKFKTDNPKWIQFNLPDPNGLFSAMSVHLKHIKKKESKPYFTCKDPKEILPYLITSSTKMSSKPRITKDKPIIPLKDQIRKIISKFD